ncbi:flagellar protein FliO [Burkholderia pseudomallei]|nr:flagellar protein FliO [Burkholderia pseudomallei]EDO87646.1 flagellar protein FliO [Burkholderia pseudomallei 406e]EDS87904.1 hypothetical protein BURPSS13_S0146 [Burkholderia pseudomallei S13]EEC32262.1 conserved hypothetical protein [Burkholderia pseudomallei 576]PNW96418.1 flagellar protein FliO [Burkholderia sp. 136(2017)]PNX11553.1 flagellar protein FliO [Burkholderia sp. 129]PNX25510.1 flagellar protein FliO [Burkholderia sp. 117]PNX33736.1 flagellar protein FliO [Burkholderia sp. 
MVRPLNDARTQRRRRTPLALAHGTMKRPAKAAHAATPAAIRYRREKKKD